MLPFLIVSAYAKVVEVIGLNDKFDQQTLALNQFDSVVFRSDPNSVGRHTIVQVQESNCGETGKIKSGELSPGQKYFKIFDEAGVYHIADSGKCGSGYRMTIEVKGLPQNENAKKFDPIAISAMLKQQHLGSAQNNKWALAFIPLLALLL